VRVKVIAVDVDRQRIGLTLRLNDTPQRDQGKGTVQPSPVAAMAIQVEGNGQTRFEARTLIVGHRTNPRGRWRKRCVMPVSDGDRCADRLTSCLVDASPVPTTCGTQNKRPSSAAMGGDMDARIPKVSATTGMLRRAVSGIPWAATLSGPG
jgi:hypothetical protein